MQPATVHRVATRLGIIASPHWPLTTLAIPIIEQIVDVEGALHSYRTENDRLEDLRDFRALVNAIAEDYLPENQPAAPPPPPTKGNRVMDALETHEIELLLDSLTFWEQAPDRDTFAKTLSNIIAAPRDIQPEQAEQLLADHKRRIEADAKRRRDQAVLLKAKLIRIRDSQIADKVTKTTETDQAE